MNEEDIKKSIEIIGRIMLRGKDRGLTFEEAKHAAFDAIAKEPNGIIMLNLLAHSIN